MRNHMQMTGFREPERGRAWNYRNNVGLTIRLNSMNELKSSVSSKFKPAAAGIYQVCAMYIIGPNSNVTGTELTHTFEVGICLSYDLDCRMTDIYQSYTCHMTSIYHIYIWYIAYVSKFVLCCRLAWTASDPARPPHRTFQMTIARTQTTLQTSNCLISRS